MVKGGTTYRILTDHLGSVRLVVNAATGAVAQRIDYDAWGIPTFVTGPADFQPFGFAGGLYDPDTELVRFGARDYDARTARWTSKDSVGFRGGDTNLFGYALADPVTFRDENGLWVVKGGFTGGAFAGPGATGSVGVWAGYDEVRGNRDAGVFGEAGIGTGIDASIGGFLGFSGSVEGGSRAVTYGVGWFSLTIELDPCDNSFSGLTAGVSFRGAPAGASTADTTSGGASVRDGFGALRRVLGF